MRKMLTLVLCLALLLSLAACGGPTEQDKYFDALTKDASSDVPEESVPVESAVEEATGSLSGELNISLPVQSPFVELWARRFRKLHPDVKFKFDYVVSDTSAGYPSDYPQQYITKIVTSLASGDAPDIVNLSFVSFYKYAKSGLFADLYEFMDAEPDFKREDYYTNLFETLEDPEGHLYAMPASFGFEYFILNDFMVQKMGVDLKEDYDYTMNHQDLIDLFHRAEEIGATHDETLFAEKCSHYFFEGLIFPDYMDESTGEARFDSPEFIDYLKQTDALPFENTIKQGSLYSAGWPDFGPRTSFCQRMSSTATTLGTIGGIRMAGCTNPVFYVSTSGKRPFSSTSLLAIPKGPDQELAWAFMKFMIEEKDNFPEKIDIYGLDDLKEYVGAYNYAMPINKNNCRKFITAMYDEKTAERFCTYNETLNARIGLSSELMNNLQDIFIDFYDNHLLSAEECASQLQERAWIYLNE